MDHNHQKVRVNLLMFYNKVDVIDGLVDHIHNHQKVRVFAVLTHYLNKDILPKSIAFKRAKSEDPYQTTPFMCNLI